MNQMGFFSKGSQPAYIGVRTGRRTTPSMYAQMLKWMDGSIAHTVNLSKDDASLVRYELEYLKGYRDHRMNTVYFDFLFPNRENVIL